MADELLATLDVDYSSAVSGAGELSSAIESALGEGASAGASAVADALSGISPTDVQIPVDADVSGAEATIGTLTDQPPVDIPVDADVAPAEASVQNLEEQFAAAGATPIDLQVDDSMVVEATGALDGLSQAENDASQGAGDVGSSSGKAAGGLAGMGGAGIAAEAGTAAASGSLGGFAAAAERGAGSAGAAIGVVAALGAGLGGLYTVGVQAASGEERLAQAAGSMAEQIQKVNVGSLHTTLTELGHQFGSTSSEMDNAAARAVQFGTAGGFSAKQSATFADSVAALAARAVALNPSLGNVADVADQMAVKFGRVQIAARQYNLALSTADVNQRAMEISGKSASNQLTLQEKSFAAIQLASEKYGSSLANVIATGAENAANKQKALTATFKEGLEAIAEPVVAPVQETLRELIPVGVEAARVIADIGGAALPVLALAAGLVGPPLHLIADVLGVIPGPAREAAVGAIALAVALNLLGEGGIVGGIAAIGAGFAALPGFIAGIPAAVGGAVSSFIGLDVAATEATGSQVALAGGEELAGAAAIQAASEIEILGAAEASLAGEAGAASAGQLSFLGVNEAAGASAAASGTQLSLFGEEATAAGAGATEAGAGAEAAAGGIGLLGPAAAVALPLLAGLGVGLVVYANTSNSVDEAVSKVAGTVQTKQVPAIVNSIAAVSDAVNAHNEYNTTLGQSAINIDKTFRTLDTQANFFPQYDAKVQQSRAVTEAWNQAQKDGPTAMLPTIQAFEQLGVNTDKYRLQLNATVAASQATAQASAQVQAAADPLAVTFQQGATAAGKQVQTQYEAIGVLGNMVAADDKAAKAQLDFGNAVKSGNVEQARTAAITDASAISQQAYADAIANGSTAQDAATFATARGAAELHNLADSLPTGPMKDAVQGLADQLDHLSAPHPVAISLDDGGSLVKVEAIKAAVDDLVNKKGTNKIIVDLEAAAAIDKTGQVQKAIDAIRQGVPPSIALQDLASGTIGQVNSLIAAYEASHPSTAIGATDAYSSVIGQALTAGGVWAGYAPTTGVFATDQFSGTFGAATGLSGRWSGSNPTAHVGAQDDASNTINGLIGKYSGVISRAVIQIGVQAPGAGLAAGGTVPFAAAGATFIDATPVVVGEHGPEIVDLPGGARVTDNPRSRALFQEPGGGSVQHIYLSIDARGSTRESVRDLRDLDWDKLAKAAGKGMDDSFLTARAG